MKRSVSTPFLSGLTHCEMTVVLNNPTRTISMIAGSGFMFVRTESRGEPIVCAIRMRNGKNVIMMSRLMTTRIVKAIGSAKILRTISTALKQALKTGKSTLKAGPELFDMLVEASAGDPFVRVYLQTVGASITKSVSIQIEVGDDVALDVQLKDLPPSRLPTRTPAGVRRHATRTAKTTN